ncbi:hypothetical protein J19TS2_23140 [Cohnella xylanilytica]|nr:hypothetical protein J19TS2_23140 [Cohnella xylanilytica]
MREAFQRSIRHAEKIKGELDYGAMYFLYVEDGMRKKFVLNLAEEAGRTALLVDTAHPSQGYSIPSKCTDLLREVIYGGKEA